jgi:amino acid adenylation domain-containing protein
MRTSLNLRCMETLLVADPKVSSVCLSLGVRQVTPPESFVPFPKSEIEQSVQARFGAQVNRNPEHVAIAEDGQNWKYRDLENTSNRIARAILRELGAGEEPAALVLEKSALMVAAMLAALKAGKCYVPIDPSIPPSRNARILHDSGTRLVITNRRNLHLIRPLGAEKIRVLNLDEIDPGISDQPLDLPVSPDRLAYILYTSGSTGTPKGVTQNHRNLLHNVMKYTNGAHLCAEDRISLLGSCCFAPSVSAIFGALLNGATLCPFDLKEKGFQRLGEWLVRQEISVYHSVPSVFSALALSLPREQLFPRMRLIKLGGEPVTRKEVEFYNRHFLRSCRLYVGLGSTEMNIIRKYFLDHDSVLEGKVVPVGYEVEDTQVFLLDEKGRQVGFGEVGEIVIRSQYLAPGYWKQPDLTALKFRPDPSGNSYRLFSTGDLGRMREDGLLECVGRKDSQLKIDGVRIELGEIEATLTEHPAVGKAAVVVEAGNNEAKRLVACMIPAEDSPPDVSEIRQYLRSQLPGSMIPSRFVWVPEMRLTPSGKVDRLAIAELVAAKGARTNIRLPRTPFEETLASIWSDLFGIHPLGVNDNFFELGGTSLTAAQAITRIQKSLNNVELTFRDFLDAPTIEELGVLITRKMAERLDPADLIESLRGLGET